ncbi:protein kinase domain-containing protein [Chondromyces apiculatus]|uniref:Serine/threonine-protein kinase pkn2 n=1 Tax=Chondromyces apiculatus DSM 436 TaxID=1192034 RepID=A0A017TCR4_9BACT|nr:protein kinase [Chondromyces apiculatus]EYF06717.1 Serine/threonine-protein kinase pkn2 [Chondromyces apiculatus DSM 436]
MDLEAGTILANRYRITRPLGRGGMGEVFAAENTRTGRMVAVKLLRADSKTKASAVERFRREARAAGSINSDHVTQVLDVEDDPEHGILLVFELLEGESLIERLKRTGPIRYEELHPIIEQVWSGLADAHRAGIIHRDLKPSNVYLESRPDGSVRVKILDFGVSKLPKEMGGDTLTEMGQSLGTFSFMPPEQISKAKMVDHRADIYACTTLVYQALTGHLPYLARNILAMVELKTKAEPRKLSEVMDGPTNPHLEAFVARGLARNPDQRFQSAVEALTAWRELRPGGPISQPSSSGRIPPSSSPQDPVRSVSGSLRALVPAVPAHASLSAPLSTHAAAPSMQHPEPYPYQQQPLAPPSPPYPAPAYPSPAHAPTDAAFTQGSALQRPSLQQTTVMKPDFAATVALPPQPPPPVESHSQLRTLQGHAAAQRTSHPHLAESHAQPSSSQNLAPPPRMMGPYGTALVDSSGNPIAGFPVQPTSSHDVPRIYDENSSGPSSADLKTQVYRPQSASSAAPLHYDTPQPEVPPTPRAQPPAALPSPERSYLLPVGILIILIVSAIASVLVFRGFPALLSP